jgi:hypothetical protein
VKTGLVCLCVFLGGIVPIQARTVSQLHPACDTATCAETWDPRAGQDACCYTIDFGNGIRVIDAARPADGQTARNPSSTTEPEIEEADWLGDPRPPERAHWRQPVGDGLAGFLGALLGWLLIKRIRGRSDDELPQLSRHDKKHLDVL